jgi:GNAT superfamily N-acetyltransferase
MFDIKYDVPMEIFLEEAKSILHEHWEELALNKDKIILKPDAIKYKLLQDNNILYNIVVYDGNKIIGYSILFIQPHLHYSDNIYASVDVIYVSKEYRNGSVGARLLLATEQLAKDLKATVIVHHAKPYVPMIIKPLEKLNYKLYEHIYGKYIGD